MINPITGLDEDEDVFKQYDDQRQALIEENNGFDTRGAIAGGLASLGAAFQGKDSIGAANQIMNQRRQSRQDELSALDKWKQGKIQEITAKRDAQKFKREDEIYTAENDPNSELSKMAQQDAIEAGYKGDPSRITYAQYKAFSPVYEKRMDRKEKMLDRQEAREERRFLANQKLEEKKNEKSRLSDKQIESFSDLDNAMSDLTNLLGQLGDKSNWTGPVDGLTPDMLVGSDQVAWRSALGKYKDAYRKAVTGAGAGPSEIAILESRLPSEYDSLGNFKAKANEAIAELKRRRETLGKNLSMGGKNVSQFMSQEPETLQASKDPEVEQYAKMHGISYEQAMNVKNQRMSKQARK